MTRADVIKQFIEDQFLVEFVEGGDGVDDGHVASDTDLFKAGVLDSFGYVQLMTFIQSEYSIDIPADELLTNIFVSVDGIVAFLDSRLGRSGVAGVDF